jgi:hypothetical protein
MLLKIMVSVRTWSFEWKLKKNMKLMSWFSKKMKRRSVSRKGNRHSRIACSPGTENRGTSNNLINMAVMF